MFQVGCCHADDTQSLAAAEPTAAAVHPSALACSFFFPPKVCDLALLAV